MSPFQVYLIKLLRDQGLSREQLHTVCLALIVFRFKYALPARSGFFLKTEQTGQMYAFLMRLYKYGFRSELMDLETLAGESDERIFYEMCNQAYCWYFVLPPLASAAIVLTRPKDHRCSATP